jgi:hypothetical protein
MDRDAEHLRLLSIFYYVHAGLQAVGACLFLLYIFAGFAIAIGGAASHSSNAPPAFLGVFFVVFGGILMLFVLTMAALNYYTGRCLTRREHRTFCFVIACLSCLSIPYGTILGIFTIIVLERPQVRALFERHATA